MSFLPGTAFAPVVLRAGTKTWLKTLSAATKWLNFVGTLPIQGRPPAITSYRDKPLITGVLVKLTKYTHSSPGLTAEGGAKPDPQVRRAAMDALK